jgi:hypothetical protein
MQAPTHRYLVFRRDSPTAAEHLANKAMVEPSGTLALYLTDSQGVDHLVRAFAPACWRELERKDHA